VQELDAAAHLNTCFKHFMFFGFCFALIEEQETQVMKEHILRLKEEYETA
jgi:hypothetical protein